MRDFTPHVVESLAFCAGLKLATQVVCILFVAETDALKHVNDKNCNTLSLDYFVIKDIEKFMMSPYFLKRARLLANSVFCYSESLWAIEAIPSFVICAVLVDLIN